MGLHPRPAVAAHANSSENLERAGARRDAVVVRHRDGSGSGVRTVLDAGPQRGPRCPDHRRPVGFAFRVVRARTVSVPPQGTSVGGLLRLDRPVRAPRCAQSRCRSVDDARSAAQIRALRGAVRRDETPVSNGPARRTEPHELLGVRSDRRFRRSDDRAAGTYVVGRDVDRGGSEFRGVRPCQRTAT